MKTIYLDTEFSEGFFKPIWWLPKWFPGNKPRWGIELISIGLVDNEGNEYYAINKNYSYRRCNKWVRENVIPKLPDRLVYEDNWWDRYHGIEPDNSTMFSWNPVYKTIKQIREDILAFVIGYCDVSASMGILGSLQQEHARWIEKGNGVQFKAYYADYDWVLFCTIFGTMMDLPTGFPMYCFDLKQEFDRKMHNLWWVINTKNGDNRLRYGSGDNYIDEVVISKEAMIKLLKHNTDYPKEDDEHNALSDAAWNRDLDNYMARL